MLHATMHAVDIALCILPAVFALMIAYDFVLYVKAQRRAAKHPQWVPAKPQPAQQPIPIPEVIKPEPIAAPIRHLSSNRAKSAVKHKTFT